MELKERIQKLIDYSEKNVSQFSKYVGVKTPQAIRELLAGNTKTLSENVQSKILSTFPEINKTWLLTGEGEMLKSANYSPAPSRENSYQEDRVPLLPVEAIAGLTVGFAEGLNIHDCRMIKTPFPGAEYAIQVSGDSMYPTIKSGDMLYIKKINEKAFIPWGHVVVLDTENGAVVKEVYPCEGEEDYIEARSVNPKYPPYKIEKQSIYGMYKVLGTATINTTL